MPNLPWLKTNAKKLILHVADHPGCSIWSVLNAMWPQNASKNGKAKLRALKRQIPIDVFANHDGWYLGERGKEIAAQLREGK